MRFIIYVLYIILAFLSPFGSANIFNLSQYSSRAETTQDGILPIVFGLCALFSIFDKRVRANIKYYTRIVTVLIIFIHIICFAEFFYCEGNFNYIFILKLVIAISGFIIMSQTFVTYPDLLRKSLLIYALTCTVIVLLFFCGFLDKSYYFSNGRLWFLGINPNTYSFMIGFAIINFFIFLQQKNISIILKVLFTTSIIPLFFFLLLSGSRGSLLFLVFAIMILYYKKLISFVIISAFLLLMVGPFISNSGYDIITFERFANLGNSDDRGDLIDKTVSVFKRSPIIGVGPTGYKSYMMSFYNENRDSHNVIVSNLAMSGVLGTLFYVTFLGLLFRFVSKKSKFNIQATTIFIYMTLISLKTGSVLTYSLMWYIYAISLSINVIGRTNLSNNILQQQHALSKKGELTR